MKDVSFFPRIFLVINPVDFRKQARSLAQIVNNILLMNPLESKALFAFTNRKKDSIRLLYWDQTGLALWSKVLEQDKFRWPKSKDEIKKCITSSELKWILDGIDIAKVKKHTPLTSRKIS